MKLVYCSIVVQDNISPGGSSTESHAFRSRDTRLSHFLSASTLWHIIQEKHRGLDDALTAVWSEYRPGNGWEQLPHPNDRWVTTSTPDGLSTVHLNLLDGTLLINGKPLKHLPSSIVTHPTFCRILGLVRIPPSICNPLSLPHQQKTLDIIPSDIPGMDFATLAPISTSGFHIGLLSFLVQDADSCTAAFQASGRPFNHS